jgi:hypothetical protein
VRMKVQVAAIEASKFLSVVQSTKLKGESIRVPPKHCHESM